MRSIEMLNQIPGLDARAANRTGQQVVSVTGAGQGLDLFTQFLLPVSFVEVFDQISGFNRSAANRAVKKIIRIMGASQSLQLIACGRRWLVGL